MAEIDTKPLESVQDALFFFEQKIDQNTSCPNPNEEEEEEEEDEIQLLLKQLAHCKLQLEVKANENRQAMLQLEVLHHRLEASRQSDVTAECEALREELVLLKEELNSAKEAHELLQAELVLERENTREVLMQMLELNEATLSSALAAIAAEEESLAFLRAIGPEFFVTGEKLTVVWRLLDTVESLQNEMLAKAIEVDYLQSELKQAKELCNSSQELEQAEAAFPFPVGARRVGGIPGEDRRAVRPGSVEEDEEPQAEALTVLNSAVCTGNSEAAESCTEASGEDFQTVPSDGQNVHATMSGHVVEHQEPGAEATTPNPTYCRSNLEVSDTLLVAETPRGDGEFWELGEYVLVGEKAKADELREALDAARGENSDLRFGLEEALRRAELAEEAAAAIEERLKEQEEQRRRRRRHRRASSERVRTGHYEASVSRTATPCPMPARPGGGEKPASYVTLGQVLNMR